MKTMRYLLMALVLAVMLPVMGLAANGLSDIDSANTSLTIKLDFSGMAAPDSCVLKWHLIFGTTNPPKTRSDSVIVGINGTADTVKVSGLHNGTKYYYSANFWAQDTTTGTRPVHYYSIGIDSGITKTVGQTIAAATAATYRQFQIKDTYFGADSAFKLIRMQYRVKGSPTWTDAAVGAVISNVAVGRDSTFLASVDTLNAVAAAPVDLLVSGVIYEVRVVATDSTGSDTSNTLEITVLPIPAYWDYLTNTQKGLIGPNTWHWQKTFNESQDYLLTDEISITEYKTAEFHAHLAGIDNNKTFDSVTVYLQTNKFGTWVSIDTLITRDIDTATAIVWRKVGMVTNGDSVEMKAIDFGDQLRIYAIMTDSSAATGDTMDLDARYLDIIGIFKK